MPDKGSALYPKQKAYRQLNTGLLAGSLAAALTRRDHPPFLRSKDITSLQTYHKELLHYISSVYYQ